MARARHLFGVAMGMDRQAQPAVVAHRERGGPYRLDS